MKNLCQNFDVRATIPVKIGKKSTWDVLFPRRLWLPTWTCDQRKEGKLNLKVQCGTRKEGDGLKFEARGSNGSKGTGK